MNSAVAALLLEEADLGIERLAGAPVLEHGPMLPVVVFRVDVEGEVAAGEPGRLGAGTEAREREVLADADARVRAPRAIPVARSRQVAGGGAIDEHRADAGPVAQLAADAQHREVVAWQQADVLGLHVQHADVEAAHLAGQAPAAANRHQVPVIVKADATAEEQIDFLFLAHGEETGVLQEERTLLRKAQVETREIDLLGIDLDLREVGVVGEVEVQAGRDAELGVGADAAIEVGLQSWREVPVGRADDVGQHFEVARRLELEAAQFAG